MKMMLRYTDANTGEKIELPIDAVANCLSVSIPPQPTEGIFGLTTHVSSDAVIVRSEFGSQLSSTTFLEMISDAQADLALDPEDKGFIAKHWKD
jgi:hypothetical protein